MKIALRFPTVGYVVLEVPDGPIPVFVEHRHDGCISLDRWGVKVGAQQIVGDLLWCPEIEGFDPKLDAPQWARADTSWVRLHNVSKVLENRLVC